MSLFKVVTLWLGGSKARVTMSLFLPFFFLDGVPKLLRVACLSKQMLIFLVLNLSRIYFIDLAPKVFEGWGTVRMFS